MKKKIFCTFLITCALFFVLQSSAAPTAYNWYCVHVKDHKQPAIAPELSFIEECEGYYIDRRYGDDAKEKILYLTFDAGYENGNVARVLDVMREEGVTGAFFVLENLIQKNTELLKRMVDEGHLVCNHTARHRDMSALDEAAFLSELQSLEKQYEEKIGGKMAPFYRPPQGRFSKENLAFARKNGYKTIFWSFAYPDWDNAKQMDPEKAKRVILENVHNGEIMLLHPTSQTNADILGEVIRELKAQGYRFGSLYELTEGGV